MIDAIAGEWPTDLQFALRRLMLRVVPLVEALPRPLGWAGSVDAVLAMAREVPPAPIASRYADVVLRLGLTPVEEMLLLAATSTDFDLRFASLWQILGNRIDVMRPRIHAILQLAAPDEQAEVIAILDPAHVLRALGLVTLAPGGDGPLDQLVVGTAALAAMLTGHDIAAAILGVRLETPAPPIAAPQAVAAALATPIERAAGDAVAVVLDGSPGSGRGWLGRRFAAAVGRGVVSVRVDPERIAGQLAAVARTALVERLVPFVDVPATGEEAVGAHLAMLAGVYGGPWLLACDGRPSLPGPVRSIVVPVLRPDAAHRDQMWTSVLGPDRAALAAELARRFPLGAGAIFRAGADGAARGSDPTALAQAARDQLDRRSSLAERIRTDRRLDDLIASPTTRALLDEIIAFARQRRKVFDEWGFARWMRGGLKVLFSGPPGTGKTMSAEIIAAELDLDLFRIDLSNVVSKWIGETEKNLKQVFDQAEGNGGILLFDEADSLFGKRTADVRSSTDRYANLEVNYLLQRLETHDGIVLLTTNLESGIDEGFRRRLNFRVRFHAPDVDERERLWQLMIPPQTPIGSRLDFALVAERFDMAGGNIKNAVLRAAVLAANEGTSMFTRHLLAAGEREFTEIGRIAGTARRGLSE